MMNPSILDEANESEEQHFFAEFESAIECDSGEAARSHLEAGRAIYVEDERYPGRAVRVHPDGRRELMRLDPTGTLVVEQVLQ